MKIEGDDISRILAGLKLAIITWQNRNISKGELVEYKKLYNKIAEGLKQSVIDEGFETYGGPENCEGCDD